MFSSQNDVGVSARGRNKGRSDEDRVRTVGFRDSLDMDRGDDSHVDVGAGFHSRFRFRLNLGNDEELRVHVDSTVDGKAFPLFTTDDPALKRRHHSYFIVQAAGSVELATFLKVRQDGGRSEVASEQLLDVSIGRLGMVLEVIVGGLSGRHTGIVSTLTSTCW